MMMLIVMKEIASDDSEKRKISTIIDNNNNNGCFEVLFFQRAYSNSLKNGVNINNAIYLTKKCHILKLCKTKCNDINFNSV